MDIIALHENKNANTISYRFDRKDSEVSPGTLPPRNPAPANSRANIAPWDTESSPGGPQGYAGNVPAINRQPPSASPWSSSDTRQGQMPTSVFGSSYYNDSNDNLGSISPGFAPANGMSFSSEGDDRRPSIASATTVSSTGSKSSVGGKFHKKLHGFFGDEYKGLQEETSRQNSEASSMQSSLPAFAPGIGGNSSRHRNNSLNDTMMRSGPPSPTSSRPRTPAPQPSSEVTPWVYQDTQVRWRCLSVATSRRLLTRAAGEPRRLRHVASRTEQRPVR